MAGVGRGIGEKTSLPGVKVVANVSGLGLLPSTAKLGVDLGGGGMIGGDVTYETSDVGVALDQLAREILRHLSQHKLTVVWLFDESESMKDDQKAIREKFDRVASELKVNADAVAKKKAAEVPLTHAIVGFGNDLHFELEKPTPNVDLIGQAIEQLKIDDTGTENTMHALARGDQPLLGPDHEGSPAVDRPGDRRVGRRRQLRRGGAPGGRRAQGADLRHRPAVALRLRARPPPLRRPGDQGRLLADDPPRARDRRRRMLQWDGLHNRWDEQASGFAPYELARLAKDSGGIYFLLPSEENMRVRRQEKAYSIATLKEYVPDYDSRARVRRAAEQVGVPPHALRHHPGDQGLPLPLPLPGHARRADSRRQRGGHGSPPSGSRSCWRSRTGSKASRSSATASRASAGRRTTT